MGRQTGRNREKGSVLSGLAVVFHRYDDIPLFAPCFDIPVRLGSLPDRQRWRE
jgi:hypothetical protein